MINITRTYSSATVKKQEGSLNDVVTAVYCICRGEDTETGVFDTVGESIVMDPPVESNFIDFSQLTSEIVDSWVINKQQYIELEDKVKNGILAKINTIYEDKPLPFSENQELI